MPKLRASLRGNNRAEAMEWNTAVKQSAEYACVLGLEPEDIKNMEDQHAVLHLSTSAGDCRVHAKHTCTPDSDGQAALSSHTPGWQTILQARLTNSQQYSSGDGTRYFTTLPQEIHAEVTAALAAEQYEITHEKIWP